MKKSALRILTIVGTRPELIRLSRIIPLLDETVDHILVHTQQNFDYELNKLFFEELGIREPDYRLDVAAETTAAQIGNILTQADIVLEKERPDAVLILGDTNSSLVAYLARRRHIPIFHMEAGNRSFDWNVPEEINRRIVDHISDINLCYSEQARLYLLREGIHPGSIYVVGSPMAEIYATYRDSILASTILKKENVALGEYFVASIHREENVDDPERLATIMASLEAVARKYSLPMLVSLHPRTKKRIKEAGIVSKQLRFIKPCGYIDFVRLQKDARCVLSDSGSLPEEAAVIGFPAVQLRVSSERPEAFEVGSVILTGPHRDSILASIALAISQFKAGSAPCPEVYLRASVSDTVVKLILGLTSVFSQTETKPLSL